MMTTSEFQKYYETISDVDLLLILDNKKDYQQSAIEAALQEFDRRSLTQEQIIAARQIIFDRNNRKSRRREEMHFFTENIKSATKEVLDSLHPVSEKGQTSRTKLILIVLVFGLISIYQIGSNYHWLELYLRNFFEHPLSSLVVVLPTLLLPIAIICFAFKKKIGWILFAGFLTYSALWSLRILATSFSWKSSDIKDFDELFPQPSMTIQILSLLFYLGTLFIISKADIRDQYNLTKKTAFKVFGISWFVTFAIIFFSS